VACSSFFFTACRKDDLLMTQSSSQTQIKSINLEAAKQWYNQERTLSSSFNATQSSGIFSKATPDWSSTSNDFNQKNREFLVVPTTRLKTARGGVKILITQDSSDNLVGNLVYFKADSIYHLKKQGKYDRNDFTGTLIYMDMAGNYQYGVGLVNGIIKSRVEFKDSADKQIRLRSCTKIVETSFEMVDEGGDGGWVIREVETVKYVGDCWRSTTPTGGLFSSGVQTTFGTVWGQIGGDVINCGSCAGSLGNYGSGLPTNLFLDDNFFGDSEFQTQQRYLGAGFTFSEYNTLRADNELFLHVDMFMNKHIGDYDAQQHAKDMATRALTESDLRDAIVAWNPFIVEICKDLAYDLLWELFKKHAPGLKDKAIIESMIQNLKTGSYLDLTHDVLQIAKRYVPWAKFIDIAWDGFEFGKKFEQAFTAFTKIQKLGDNVAEKLAAILKNDFGGILKNIKWKNQEWGAVMPNINAQTFWQKLRDAFPGGEYSIGHNPQNPLEQTLKFREPKISFKFYPGSNTTSGAGLPNCYTLDITTSSTFKLRFCE
jgi:hypothetical protein